MRRLSKRSGAREQYDDFLLKEYQDLGAVERELEPEKEGYYLPHHAVFKEDATTTKLRVVFNASATIQGGKFLLQELWKQAYDWDQVVTPELQLRISKWWGEFERLHTVHFQRWLGLTNTSLLGDVHLFVDASELGYSCCIYILTEYHSHLVFAKAKVSPLKKQTLSRLELQAAFIGTRWLKFVLEQSQLKIKEVHAWTDSMMTKYWITKQPYHWKTFVANRESEIQAISRSVSAVWHHCPGSQNPADLVSRGASLGQLNAPFWLFGPSWLKAKVDWPHSTSDIASNDAIMETSVKVVLATP